MRFIVLSALCLAAWTADVHAAGDEAFPAVSYDERLPFGPVFLGEQRKQTAEVRLRPGSKDDPFFISQYPDPPFRVEQGSGRRGDSVDVDGDQVKLSISFTPTRAGEWRDSVVLVRFDPFDRIVIRMSGIGVSGSRQVTLDYGNVLTGDTVIRGVIVPDPRGAGNRISWRLLSLPKAPFTSLNPQVPVPIRPGSDTLGFLFAYHPTESGQLSSTISIVRIWENEVALDTIVCKLTGTGKRMPPAQQVRARDVVVGDADTVTLDTELPLDPRHPYGYRLEPRGQGPVAGRVADPITKSETRRIVTTFLCTPTQVGGYERTFALLRFNGNTSPVDSTIITVTGVAKERPEPAVRIRLGFDAETQTTSIGDTVLLPVTLDLTSDRPIPGIAVNSLRCTVTYNPTVLVPVAFGRTVVADRGTIDDAASVTVAIEPSVTRQFADGDTVITLAFVAVVGDDDRSAVRIHEMTVTRQQAEPIVVRTDSMFTRRATTVELDDVWQHQNGQRRVNTLQGTLDVTIDPNPVDAQATMRVVNVPKDIGTFTIVDPVGRVIADLSQAVRGGTTDFTISTGAGADVTLQTGSYYARLLVRAEDGTTIHSVARLIVVR